MAKNRTIALVAVAALFGYLAGRFFDSGSTLPDNSNEHWEVVERYKAQMEDPTNRRIVDGMVGIDTDIDPVPALSALASAGEIAHVDLVFPNVPVTRESNEVWMKYVDEHPGILYAEGNPKSVGFEPSSVQPLHLNLWFRNAAKPDVVELVKRLEAMPDSRD